MRTITISTNCGASSTYKVGSIISWSGGDSAKRFKSKPRYATRVAQFYKDPWKWVHPDKRPRTRPKKGPKGSRKTPRTELVVHTSRRALPREPSGRSPRSSTRRFAIDVNQTANMFQDGNIFDRAREKRIRTIEAAADSNGDYGTPHAYTKSWEVRNEMPIIWDGAGQSNRTGTPGSCGFGASPPNLWTTYWTPDDDYKLLSRMRNKVVGTDFNLASFLGAEGLDTLAFFTDTATRIYRAQLAVRKLKFKEAFSVLTNWGRYHPKSRLARERAQQEDVYRDLAAAAFSKERGQHWYSVPAKTWLEYHLAVEPLLGDCVAAAEQLSHITNLPAQQRIQASVRKRIRNPVVAGPWWDCEYEVRKTVVAYFKSTPSPIAFSGLQDPEVTIWNAIPLSFVADYFLNIGGWLEARATAAALPSGTYITTAKSDANLTGLRGLRNSSKVVTHTVRPAAGLLCKHRKGTITRSISASMDVPQPKFEPLGMFKNWQRATTVASLIATSADGIDLPNRFFR